MVCSSSSSSFCVPLHDFVGRLVSVKPHLRLHYISPVFLFCLRSDRMCIYCESISLKNADEHETLENYLKLWHATFGADEQMQRMKNVAADWADVGGDRSDPILQQLDELAREIGETLAFDSTFEKGYKAWEADLTEAERCVCVCVCTRASAFVLACLRGLLSG